ncbi:hypothetical protein ACFCV3_32400 [Kribbella sp. NPDC056345]|uniref:hypothetical protein n=1 Tax=Kribbella sp. NPDC056345 TaxID=3345789 RepID=UPI0035D798CB
MKTFDELISRFDQWATERDLIESDVLHSRRAWEESDDAGIALLREMVAALRTYNTEGPASGGVRTLGALAAGRPLRVDPRLAPSPGTSRE